jgi:hypothetical protein
MKDLQKDKDSFMQKDIKDKDIGRGIPERLKGIYLNELFLIIVFEVSLSLIKNMGL